MGSLTLAILTALTGLVKVFGLLLGIGHDKQIRSAGAAEQKAIDNEAETKRDNDAANAGFAVGGLHDEQADPANRDNVK